MGDWQVAKRIILPPHRFCLFLGWRSLSERIVLYLRLPLAFSPRLILPPAPKPQRGQQRRPDGRDNQQRAELVVEHGGTLGTSWRLIEVNWERGEQHGQAHQDHKSDNDTLNK